MTQRTSRTADSLLPCPFCGADERAIFLHMLDSALCDEGHRYWISCYSCGCAVGLGTYSNGMGKPFFKTAKDAFEAWNRRTNER